MTLPATLFSSGFSAEAKSVSYCEVLTRYSVSLLDYSLTLHRSGARGEKTVGNTTYGDSRWSYTERQDDSGGLFSSFADYPVSLSTVIGAQRGADWSSNLTYTWSPSDRRDQLNSHVADLPDGGSLLNSAGLDVGLTIGPDPIVSVPPGWYQVPSTGSNPLTINYTLTDNSNSITNKATYILKLHDEWESKTTDTDHTWTDGQGGAHSGEERWTEAYFDDPMTSYTYDGPEGTESEEKAWEIKRTTTLKLDASAGVDFKLHDFINVGASSSVGQTIEITKPSGAAVKIGPGERAIPYIQLVWTREFFLMDHYDVGGRDSNSARSDGKWPQWDDRAPDVIQPMWYRDKSNTDPNQDPGLPNQSPHQTGPNGEF